MNFFDQWHSLSLLNDIRKKTGVNLRFIMRRGGHWMVYICQNDVPEHVDNSNNGWYRVSDLLKLV